MECVARSGWVVSRDNGQGERRARRGGINRADASGIGGREWWGGGRLSGGGGGGTASQVKPHTKRIPAEVVRATAGSARRRGVSLGTN